RRELRQRRSRTVLRTVRPLPPLVMVKTSFTLRRFFALSVRRAFLVSLSLITDFFPRTLTVFFATVIFGFFTVLTTTRTLTGLPKVLLARILKTPFLVGFIFFGTL